MTQIFHRNSENKTNHKFFSIRKSFCILIFMQQFLSHAQSPEGNLFSIESITSAAKSNEQTQAGRYHSVEKSLQNNLKFP